MYSFSVKAHNTKGFSTAVTRTGQSEPLGKLLMITCQLVQTQSSMKTSENFNTLQPNMKAHKSFAYKQSYEIFSQETLC